MIGGVDDDLVLAALREGGGEPGVAVAARIVVLEVPPARDAGPAQEQVGVERIRLEIDRDRLAGASLDRPGLRIRAVAVEQHVVAAETALLRLAYIDAVRRARRARAGARALRRAVGARGASFLLHGLGTVGNRQ